MSGRLLVQKQILTMQMDGSTEHALGPPDTAHMIDMRMRQQDRANLESVARDAGEQLIDLVSWIDQHGFSGRLASGDIPVFEEWLDSG